MIAPPLPHTARCACPSDGGCGRLIPVGTTLCMPCETGQHIHYGDQALLDALDALAPAEGRLMFIHAIALDVERTGGVASWRALLAAASGDWPEELRG
jgi:hypothetical protein